MGAVDNVHRQSLLAPTHLGFLGQDREQIDNLPHQLGICRHSQHGITSLRISDSGVFHSS